jgi:hypothetical protein
MFGLGRCDLCGFETPERELSRITLEPGHKIEIETYAGKRPRWRSPRVAYVCRRHRGEDAVGVPITTPNLTMAPGTSRLRPQPSALFDDTGLKRGGRR